MNIDCNPRKDTRELNLTLIASLRFSRLSVLSIFYRNKLSNLSAF